MSAIEAGASEKFGIFTPPPPHLMCLLLARRSTRGTFVTIFRTKLSARTPLELHVASSTYFPYCNTNRGCQSAEFIRNSQRKRESGVPERRVRYRSAVKTRILGASTQSRVHYRTTVKTRIWGARTQSSLQVTTESANLGCQNAEFSIDPQ